MPRGTVESDVGILLGKHKLSEVINAIFDIASDSEVKDLKEWFKTNGFFTQRPEDIGDQLDHTILMSIVRDMDAMKGKVAQLEGKVKDLEQKGD